MVLTFGAPVMEPAGKQAATASARGMPGPEPGIDGAHHLVDRGVAFDRAEPADRHGAGHREVAEVVAQQVHDHDVLGPVLGRGFQLVPQHARPGRRLRARRRVPLIGSARMAPSAAIRRKRSGEVLATVSSPRRR